MLRKHCAIFEHFPASQDKTKHDINVSKMQKLYVCIVSGGGYFASLWAQASSHEPLAAGLFLWAPKDSCQKIQKWA